RSACSARAAPSVESGGIDIPVSPLPRALFHHGDVTRSSRMSGDLVPRGHGADRRSASLRISSGPVAPAQSLDPLAEEPGATQRGALNAVPRSQRDHCPSPLTAASDLTASTLGFGLGRPCPPADRWRPKSSPRQ